jgi:hypothetical protein
MDACPDFIGVVKIFAFPRRRDLQLELEFRFSGKHFSKVSLRENRPAIDSALEKSC